MKTEWKPYFKARIRIIWFYSPIYNTWKALYIPQNNAGINFKLFNKL